MELTAVERDVREAGAAREAALSTRDKRAHGIVHTAPELARFVARAADELLREELGLRAGLADAGVAWIDPACGPGAFLAAALAVSQGRAPGPRFAYGVDRDASAIAVARAALQPQLRAAGVRARLEVHDTLSEIAPSRIARLAPTLCVLGNPPWIGGAQPKPAPWLDALLEDFRRDEHGARLKEQKLGVLADAYVRFVRWGCEVARGAKQGAVLALVVNASFVDGPIHRAMRGALRRFFDALHLVDLGGNALLARTKQRDDNVFGVRPAVALLLGVRRGARDERRPGTVFYLRLRGSLEHKLARLAELRCRDAAFERLAVDAPYQRFVPTRRASAEYASWPSLADAMPFHREGVQTNRDSVVVDLDRERLLARLRAFAAGACSAELAPALAALPHYDPERARAAVRAALARDPDAKRGLCVRRLAYRRFDQRWFAPIAPLCHRPRPELLAAIDASSFALVSVRKDRGDRAWAHFAAADSAIDNCLLSTRSSCRARAFPTHDPQGRDNLAPSVARAFAERIGRPLSSADFCRYALAVLATPHYRARHEEALRIDYPRIAWPADQAQFEALCASGAELVALFCSTLPEAEGAAALAQAAARLDLLW